MEDNRRRLPTLFILPVALFVASAAFPALARAQCQHGVSIFKTCESPKRTCTTNGDCNDQNEDGDLGTMREQDR